MTFEEVFAKFQQNYDANVLHKKRNMRVQDMSRQWVLAHAVEELGEVMVEEALLESSVGDPLPEEMAPLVEEMGDLFGCMAGYMVRRGLSPMEVFSKLLLKIDQITE